MNNVEALRHDSEKEMQILLAEHDFLLNLSKTAYYN